MQPTLAHIHVAYAGDDGPIVVGFSPDAADPNRWIVDSADVLTADEMNALLAGKLYVNVHSDAYPAGEIRTQLEPQDVQVVFTPLTPEDVVPASDSTAEGLAAATVNKK